MTESVHNRLCEAGGTYARPCAEVTLRRPPPLDTARSVLPGDDGGSPAEFHTGGVVHSCF